MQNALTQEDIAAALHQMGLRRGDAVEVHSSMRSMGFVEGGAPAVIRALIEVVSEKGAILMSTYRVTPLIPLTEEEKKLGITAKVRKFGPENDCKSGMGIIADTFRRWPGTSLGEGINRVSAWGRDARLHSQGYQHLFDIGGWVLLIGVDIHRCSSMHTAEDKAGMPEKIETYFELPIALQAQYPRDQWYVEYSEPGRPAPADAWGKIQKEAEERGLLKHGSIGEAECLLFKARDVVGIYEEHLRKDPFALFGIQKD
jgi:aminoglycoside N3'-acetyltransferase